MNKIVTILVVVLISSFVAVKMTGTSSEETQVWLEEQRIEEMLENYKNFKQTLDDTLDSLAEGKLGLKEAQKRVLTAARRFAPNYLQLLPFCEPGLTSEERAARNLVGHLKTWAEVKPGLAPRIRELEMELAEFVTVQK
jgi:hypothetical protein